MVNNLIPKNQISVGFKDGPYFVFESDIPLGVITVWCDSDIEFAFTGDQRMRSEDLGQPFPDRLLNIHDFLRAVKSSIQFHNRPFATTPSLRR